jgi:2-keto-4-pentenoate hydratase/2-oxohepta-3-ene-1,7-dioic acid hydratase in catechol pathway
LESSVEERGMWEYGSCGGPEPAGKEAGMKLMSFTISTVVGAVPRIGVLLEDKVIDLNMAYARYLSCSGITGSPYEVAQAIVPPDMTRFLKVGKIGKEAVKRALESVERQSEREPPVGPGGEAIVYKLADVKLLAPVPRPNSIRDTLSFEGHRKSLDKSLGKPMADLWYEMPSYYKGNPCSVQGTDEPIVWPPYTEKLDFELEYGVYIGKQGKNIPADAAASYIAGYTIFNDVSARDIQSKEKSLTMGPTKGKDFDTGNIMGPCMVTPDELDVRDMKMEARINGEVWCGGNAGEMYWTWPAIIAYISVNEALYPGDFIGSGTLAGCCGAEMNRWIQPGDVIEFEAEGIGILRNKVIREPQGVGSRGQNDVTINSASASG